MCLRVINFHLYLGCTTEFLEEHFIKIIVLFLDKLKHQVSHNLLDALNFCRMSLLAMNEYNLKTTAFLLQII